MMSEDLITGFQLVKAQAAKADLHLTPEALAILAVGFRMGQSIDSGVFKINEYLDQLDITQRGIRDVLRDIEDKIHGDQG